MKDPSIMNVFYWLAYLFENGYSLLLAQAIIVFVFNQPLENVHAFNIFHYDGQVLEILNGSYLSHYARMWLLNECLSNHNLCS